MFLVYEGVCMYEGRHKGGGFMMADRIMPALCPYYFAHS